MDNAHFDALTRRLSSRRTALGGLVGGLVALIGLGAPEEASAHNPLPRCRRIKNPAARQRCRRNANRHNRQHRICRPQPIATTCAPGCGPRRNNCGKTVACSCPAGKGCLINGSCARACLTPGQGPECPTGCGCSPLAEGGLSCFVNSQPCDSMPPCSTTADCGLGYQCRMTGCGPMGTSEGRCSVLCPG